MSALYRCRCCGDWATAWTLAEGMATLAEAQRRRRDWTLADWRAEAEDAMRAGECAACWVGDGTEPSQEEAEAEWGRHRDREVFTAMRGTP